MTRIAAARKRQILDAAAVCFHRLGFHQASMQDICSEAQLSPGSVYRYFRSKDEIIAAFVAEDLAESQRQIELLRQEPKLLPALRRLFNDRLATFGREDLSSLTVEVTAEALRNPKIAAVVRSSEDQTAAAFADTIKQAQLTGEVRGGLDPRAMADVLIALLDGLWWRKTLNANTNFAQHRKVVSTLLNGLSAKN